MELSIKERIIKFVSKIVIILVVVFIVGTGSIASYFLSNRAANLLEARTDAVVKGTEGWFNAQETRVIMLADILGDNGYASEKFEEMEEFLANAMKENEAAYDYYYGGEDGNNAFASGWDPGPDGYDAKSRDWYQQAVAKDSIYVSEAYVDADTGKVIITIAKPVKENGQLKGVLAADFFMDALSDMAESMTSDSSFPILVDKDGTVLTHKDKKLLPVTDANGDMVATKYSDIGIDEELIGAGKAVNDGTLTYQYRAQYIESADITVVYAMTNIGYYYMTVIYFLVSITFALVVYFVILKKGSPKLEALFEPMNELNEVADNMTNGVLDYTATYTTEDEIGQLCVAIENSNAAIKSYIDDIGEKLSAMSQGDLTVNIDMDYVGNFETLKTSINEIAISLRNTMEVILKASDMVRVSAGNVAEGAENLEKNVEDVTAIVTRVDGQIEEIQEDFQKSLLVAKDSMELSENVNKQMDESNDLVSLLTKAMDEINDKSNAIMEIINIINGIAGRTNLLALNASIEATRAGEAGAGFAVVASSVRELAAQTAEAAESTKTLIEESTKAIERGNLLVKQTSESMQKIVELTNDVNSHIETIAENIELESKLVSNVSESMKSMEEISRSTHETSERCVELSADLNLQVDVMNEKITTFKL